MDHVCTEQPNVSASKAKKKLFVPEFPIHSALKCTCGFYRYERVYTYKRDENYATASFREWLVSALKKKEKPF